MDTGLDCEHKIDMQTIPVHGMVVEARVSSAPHTGRCGGVLVWHLPQGSCSWYQMGHLAMSLCYSQFCSEIGCVEIELYQDGTMLCRTCLAAFC